MNNHSKYWETIKNEMYILAKNPKVVFLGQQCMSEDFYGTLVDIPSHARREMPVAEEMQLGICIGMSLEDYLPVCIYQRMDFIMRTMDQLVNHLNLINRMSYGKFNPKVVIRTTIGTTKPLNCGLQHSGNLTELLKKAVDFPVLLLNTVKEVKEGYKLARKIDTSIILIEKQELYFEHI